jgi:hypothetical protein
MFDIEFILPPHVVIPRRMIATTAIKFAHAGRNITSIVKKKRLNSTNLINSKILSGNYLPRGRTGIEPF